MKERHPEWNLKFVDDYYSEAPQKDDFNLLPEVKIIGNDDDKPRAQQVDLARVPPPSIPPADVAIAFGLSGGRITEEGDEFSLNIILLAIIYPGDIPKGN